MVPEKRVLIYRVNSIEWKIQNLTVRDVKGQSFELHFETWLSVVRLYFYLFLFIFIFLVVTA